MRGEISNRTGSRLLGIGTSVLIVAAVSACASSDVTGVSSATHDQIRSIAVSEVSVTLETPKPNPKLQAALKEELERAMPRCATGQVPHRMQVAITDFEDQDVAKSILVGDEIELAGRVTFVDVAADATTGEYYVENSFFWGGFLGAAMMSDAERKLSKDFAENLCEELFGITFKAGEQQANASQQTQAQSKTAAKQGDAQQSQSEPQQMCRANVGWISAIGPVRPWDMVPCDLLHANAPTS